ncbi:hypothetical protein B0H34DRAFT_703263 [Crassisporium funariophilum]|nr:hypothetical protein B0H34DRAFT_703263 [Crassisporium funariophilum]
MDPSLTSEDMYAFFNNPANGNICIHSSDGKHFYLQRSNLEASTGAFPPAGFEMQPGEVTKLEEPATVLVVLFQFVCARRHPDLADIAFDLLAEVAEAAEKYQVFSAINTCFFRMRDFSQERPAQVLVFADKHAYPKLVQEAAVHLACLPLIDVVEALPPYLLIRLVNYHNQRQAVYDGVLESVLNAPRHWRWDSTTPDMCNACSAGLIRNLCLFRIQELTDAIIIQKLEGLEDDLQERHPEADCQGCYYQNMLEEILETLRNDLPAIKFNP